MFSQIGFGLVLFRAMETDKMWILGTEAMRALAKSYPPDKLGSEAYSMYEKIRPQVPGGMKGWGAKGYFDLNLLRQLHEKQKMLSD